MRRRSHALNELLDTLKPAEFKYLQQRLPTRKEPGSKHYAHDFEVIMSVHKSSADDTLTPKRRLRLHEAILEELTHMGTADRGEQMMLSHLHKGLWLRSRLLYRQAMVEFVRAHELVAQYQLNFYRPALNTHIQDTLRFMVDYKDFLDKDLELRSDQFEAEQTKIYQQLTQESRVHDALFKFFWLKLELDNESPVLRRQQLIEALRPLEALDITQDMLSTTSKSNLLSNLSSLYYIEGRYAESLVLMEEVLAVNCSRPEPHPSYISLEFLYVKMNILLLQALLGDEASFEQSAEGYQEYGQQSGFKTEHKRQLAFEIYLRRLQVAFINADERACRQTLESRAHFVELAQAPLINEQYLQLFEANAMAICGEFRRALKHLAHYQLETAKPDSLLAVYIGLLRLGCKLKLKEFEGIELTVRDMRRALMVLTDEPLFASILELFERTSKRPELLKKGLVDMERQFKGTYYLTLCRSNSALWQILPS